MSEQSRVGSEKLHEKIAVFSIGATHIWSGQRSNSECDFTLGKNGKLPPKEARASLGSKYLVNPATLSPFYRAKDAMVTLLQETGVRYLGGYAVALEKAKEIEAKLTQCVSDFEAAKAAFLADYAKHVSDWAARPELIGFGDRIRQDAPTLEYVERALTCGYSVYRVMPLSGDEQIATDEGLSDELYCEVRASAKALYRDSFEGKNEATRRVFGAIQRIAEKLRSLSFLDEHALSLSEEVTRRLSAFGKHGPYKGSEFTELTNIVLMLTLPIPSQIDRKEEKDVETDVATEAAAMPALEPVPEAQGTKDDAGSISDSPEPEKEFALVSQAEVEDLNADLFKDLDAFVESETGHEAKVQEAVPMPETVPVMPTPIPSRTLCVAGLVL